MKRIDLAKESSVQEVKEAADVIEQKTGSSGDDALATGSTLFSLIKYLVDRFTGIWTDARAARLDNLDTKVSTLAPASTLDTVNTNIGASGNTANASGTTLFALLKFLTTNLTLARIQYLDKLNGGVTASLQRTYLLSHYTIVSANTTATLLSVTGKGYISWIYCPTNAIVTINIDGVAQSVTQMVNIGGAPGHVLLRFTSYCIITVQTTTSGQAYAGFLGALEF